MTAQQGGFPVSKFFRIPLASFLTLAFSLGAYSAPDAVPVNEEVIALREAVPGLNDAADINSVVEMFAALQMRVIGGDDSTWKRDNPNWRPVLNKVREDLKKDLRPALAAEVANTALLWNRALATHLSTSQIHALLGFYHSNTGRRYRAFEERLIAIQAEESSMYTVALASGGMDPKEVAHSPPSAAQNETRKQIVALSWADQVTPAMGPAASLSHGASASDDKAVNDMMVDLLVMARGPALDELAHQYQQDLNAFSSFHESAMAKSLISVYGEVAKESADDASRPGLVLTSALQHSVDLHTPAWKAAYEAGRIAKQPVVK
jgi:hypothetical protein